MGGPWTSYIRKVYSRYISNNFNSFVVLDNSDISDLAGGMGINVSEYQFEIFDLMKDIEVARYALDNVKKLGTLILMNC
jgi:hypothetical protein